ncbi:PREDICTED: uncharacterized protein LOC106110177 [Papilio polytes]|uniref:uncharacterized protein LOC106110177 n=1 Tax=Papilio polytes TaxID=76194 RepID=UPI000675ED6C|nr:PREDICTED: uncharacterized protein LOC106110177 [Papilio polytes]
MYSTRYVPGAQSTSRKSRLEGKPSLLPKPRRTGSTEPEIRRPSGAGHRSSSAEPPRATFGGRLSREPSATNLPPSSSRSKSQQSDMRYGGNHYMSTPLHSNHNARTTNTPLEFRLPASELKHGVTPLRYSHNLTTTPRRTGDESSGRSWEQALDRVLAFVTVKDQRPLSSAGWQRAAAARVGEALSARAAEGGKALALLRPLTIARFIDIVVELLAAIYTNPTLNTDNYVTKLPHITKRLLYPGAVSKSWLRTVNTLHAFPHALALLAYLTDLVHFCESPIEEELIYLAKDDLARLKQDFIFRSWQRFQMPEYQFDDLAEEYLQNLKILLGNDDEKIQELERTVQKQESQLEDETEAAARADVARREGRAGAVRAALRGERAAALHAAAAAEDARAARQRLLDGLTDIDAEVERAVAESQRLVAEVSAQSMSVSERAQLLEQLDYAFRVHDSKTALADHIAKMVVGKETELAGWQKRTLDSCLQYKQALIHLAPRSPDLADYNIDENELMSASCAEKISSCVCVLRERAAALAAERAQRTSARAATKRHAQRQLEVTRAKIEEVSALVEAEQALLEEEVRGEREEGARAAAELTALSQQAAALLAAQAQHAQVDTDLEFWRQQDVEWRSKLSSLQERVASARAESQHALVQATRRRAHLALHTIQVLRDNLPK